MNTLECYFDIDTPDIFNKWTRWIPLEHGLPTDDDCLFRKVDVYGYNMGGCYQYAYDPSREILKEQPNFLDSRTIYIGTAGSSKHRGIRSRTADFRGTIFQGYKQKNPYANGIKFRGLFNQENAKDVFVSYYPMGYGDHIKSMAHKYEKHLLDTYKMQYGGNLPPCDGPIPNVLNVKELIKVMSPEEIEEIKKKLISL